MIAVAKRIIFIFVPLFFPAQAKNIINQVFVTLEDLYNGSSGKLSVEKNAICERCKGECDWTCA